MRQKFVNSTSLKQLAIECPWAAHIMKVCGGYMCFEAYEDFKTWRNQQKERRTI